MKLTPIEEVRFPKKMNKCTKMRRVPPKSDELFKSRSNAFEKQSDKMASELILVLKESI